MFSWGRLARGSAETSRRAALVVLVHDGRGVPVRDAVLVAQPIHTLFETEQARAVFQRPEPLGELAPGHHRDLREQLLVRFLGVVPVGDPFDLAGEVLAQAIHPREDNGGTCAEPFTEATSAEEL